MIITTKKGLAKAIDKSINTRLDDMYRARMIERSLMYNKDKKYKDQKNYAFYSGIESTIYFYKNNTADSTTEKDLDRALFYRKYKSSTEIVSTDMPRKLVHNLTNILFHPGVNVDGDDNDEIAVMMIDLTRKLFYSGSAGMMLNLDGSYTVYDTQNVYTCDDEIIFTSEWVEKKNTFMLEIANGYGYRMYNLFMNGEPADLTLSRKTRGFTPVEYYNPLIRPAVYCNIGESIYEGNYHLFSALDSYFTHIKNWTNTASPVRTINSDYLPRYKKTDDPIMPSKLDFDYIEYRKGNAGETDSNPVSMLFQDYSIEPITQALELVKDQLFQNIGINSVSFGDKVEYSNIGYQSRKLMEKKTIQTREMYLRTILPVVKELVFTYMNMMNNATPSKIMNKETFDKTVEVKVNPYLQMDLQDYTDLLNIDFSTYKAMSINEVRELYNLPPLVYTNDILGEPDIDIESEIDDNDTDIIENDSEEI